MKILLLIVFFLFLTNCAQTNEDSISQNSNDTTNALDDFRDTLSKANFTWINENIVQETCFNCHNNDFAAANLTFLNYKDVMRVVVPGAPDQSSFYTRSFTTTFFTLSTKQKEIIRLWIEYGAKDN